MRRGFRSAVTVGAALTWSALGRAQLPPHDTVEGPAIDDALLPHLPRSGPWSALSTTRFPATGRFDVVFSTPIGAQALEIPACANLSSVDVDGARLASVGPLHPAVRDLSVDGLAHVVTMHLEATSYEPRTACSYPPRAGVRGETVEGLGAFSFLSVHAKEGGGRAVIYVPKGHDLQKPAALLVGLHPWNGTAWTYAAYAELLREADAKDVVLLMPSGLGNSLYTEHAETEVLSAIDELARAIAVDPRRISLWGASMGGAGATTIGFHHPDRFASITSFFGDSKYDLSTYVRAILHDEAGAHRVNALDVVDNARNVPVWLIHGEDDKVSPIAQSAVLADAMKKRGFTVRFVRVPGMGHEGMLVTKFIAEVVDRAATARIPDAPARVSFTSLGPYDASVYGIRLLHDASSGDATIDIEWRIDEVHVLRARGVRAVRLPRGAFGAPPSRALPIVIDDPRATKVEIRWDDVPAGR